MSRNFDQAAKHSLSGSAPQHLRLVVDSRVSILHVQGINVDNCLVILKSKADQQAFGMAVARTERKVSNTIKDRASMVNLERLNNVRVVADNYVCATLHGKASFSL